MKHTAYKLFWAWEFEKEEKWLNEMSAFSLRDKLIIGLTGKALFLPSFQAVRCKITYCCFTLTNTVASPLLV